ncbi:MAG: VWA domain-containing protein [Candidatus Caenarcaniphilales bacterium]|nr:VWA domain-containing protein [Candidatus Caenarcaniphilales bacterium]
MSPPTKQDYLYFLIFLLLFAFSLDLKASNNPFLQNKSLFEDQADHSLEDSKAVLIVLDASGSMADPAVGANSKMLLAKQVLESVLSKISPDVEVGLRVYGSTRNGGDPVVACQDSVLLVPPGRGNRRQIVNSLRELKPTGATPISYAMRRAVEDLRGISTDKKSVVLISDGLDTCGFDPCSLARSFSDTGVKVQFNVVGFGISDDPAAQNQLQCIAANTDGKFYAADTASELTESLTDGFQYFNKNVTGQIQEIKK